MPALSPEEGTSSNRYTILGRLAGGGMADIYLAKSASEGGVERYVVLKRVLAERSRDPVFAAMFLDEARLAAQLQHPNIAQVHDIGKLGGCYFFTMEYVHGEDVRAILHAAQRQRRELPLQLTLYIAVGALAALQHAHARSGADGKPLGIVHRDVSPSNVMVSYEGAIKLLDFGVAKATQRTTESQSGTIKGKIAYLSPEQCQGKPVDRRSDIFALGILLWELLTQQRLYKRETDFAAMMAIVTEHPLPPSTVRPVIPAALDAIVMRALSKDPDGRYATASEMLEAIEEVAAHERLVLSATSTSRAMRELFGERPEPWMALPEPEAELTEMTVTSSFSDGAADLIDPGLLSDLLSQLAHAPSLARPDIESASGVVPAAAAVTVHGQGKAAQALESSGVPVEMATLTPGGPIAPLSTGVPVAPMPTVAAVPLPSSGVPLVATNAANTVPGKPSGVPTTRMPVSPTIGTAGIQPLGPTPSVPTRARPPSLTPSGPSGPAPAAPTPNPGAVRPTQLGQPPVAQPGAPARSAQPSQPPYVAPPATAAPARSAQTSQPPATATAASGRSAQAAQPATIAPARAGQTSQPPSAAQPATAAPAPTRSAQTSRPPYAPPPALPTAAAALPAEPPPAPITLPLPAQSGPIPLPPYAPSAPSGPQPSPLQLHASQPPHAPPAAGLQAQVGHTAIPFPLPAPPPSAAVAAPLPTTPALGLASPASGSHPAATALPRTGSPSSPMPIPPGPTSASIPTIPLGASGASYPIVNPGRAQPSGPSSRRALAIVVVGATVIGVVIAVIAGGRGGTSAPPGEPKVVTAPAGGDGSIDAASVATADAKVVAGASGSADIGSAGSRAADAGGGDAAPRAPVDASAVATPVDAAVAQPSSTDTLAAIAAIETRGDHAAALQLCTAAKSPSTDLRAGCAVVACNAGRVDLARTYARGLAKSARAVVEAACHAHNLVLTPPERPPPDPCELHPLECQK